MKQPKPLPLNTTRSGELACAFGTAWLDHFKPPIGNGIGCLWCAGEVSKSEMGSETVVKCAGKSDGAERCYQQRTQPLTTRSEGGNCMAPADHTASLDPSKGAA